MSFTTIVYYLAASLSIIVLMRWRLMVFAQKHQFWTLWFRLSLHEPYLLSSWSVASLLATTEAAYGFAQRPVLQESYNRPLVFLSMGVMYVFVLDFMYRSFRNRRYLHLRWKAWTGQSRTGISPGMAQYIGTPEDWKIMAQNGLSFVSRPVDRFSWGYSALITQDPTDLLKARAEAIPTGQTTRPIQQSGVYQLTANGASVSLGEKLGFQRRCSRGIMSVPVHLFKTSPMLRCGLPGAPICLAFGILSRNKGLEPRTLICNLKQKSSFRQWEEAGIWRSNLSSKRTSWVLDWSEINRPFSFSSQ
ncbi:uncharacterized protein FTJAE_5181 [Fusarium tjaetaba]|uniref:Uncharacterized protein n=1 Tax=Fusarium tjaetaba TaxID=1567544 RepID=A0A8H5VVB3_9HYPO|nr:uncharacterized protein FTJAE_5181 [Fusarium tjaetaba]KAF5638792.1 hypothetical protein FTJAE_5181 [Fusarium tjaetaba]